jgi:hypothetical protein
MKKKRKFLSFQDFGNRAIPTDFPSFWKKLEKCGVCEEERNQEKN